MELSDLTAYSKALADQQRLLILRILARESFGVLELCRILDINQPALSHHLKILHGENLLETRRQGTSIFYRRALINADDQLGALRRALNDAVDTIPLTADVACRINAVHMERRDRARAFFEVNAQGLRENQRLIAELDHYQGCVEDMLANDSTKGKVIEVGAGESELVCSLSQTFDEVTIIDNAAEMLERTRIKLTEKNLPNIRLFAGELKDYRGMADLIVLNMVLHHLASPATFFKEAHCHLNAGGRLMIIDLTSHEQDWTREACGDLWLGFDPGELDAWAEDADLLQGQSAYLGLKNGFQVQVRTFQKPQ